MKTLMRKMLSAFMAIALMAPIAVASESAVAEESSISYNVGIFRISD